MVGGFQMKVKCVRNHYFYNIDNSIGDCGTGMYDVKGDCKIGHEYDVYGMIIGSAFNYYLVYEEPHISYVNSDVFEIIDHRLSEGIYFTHGFTNENETRQTIFVGREEMLDIESLNLNHDTVLEMLKKTGI